MDIFAKHDRRLASQEESLMKKPRGPNPADNVCTEETKVVLGIKTKSDAVVSQGMPQWSQNHLIRVDRRIGPLYTNESTFKINCRLR